MCKILILAAVSMLISQLLFAADDQRPFWTQKSQWTEGDELKVTGIASNVESREVGREQAYENAIKEIKNFFSSIGEVSQIKTQMTFEEQNKDGTYNVFRLLSVDLGEVGKRQFHNRYSSQIGHPSVDTGEVKIVTVPANAEIYLDSDLIGRSNAEIETVGTGSYQLHLRLANFLPKTLKFSLAKGEKKLIKETLDRRTESVQFTGTSGAIVKLKERADFITIPGQLALEVGRIYQIQIEKDGYYPQDREIEVVDGMTPTIKVMLQPMPAEVTILAEPEGSEITIDGKAVGKSPLQSIKVMPGAIEIEIAKAGYVSQKMTVSIAPTEKKLITDIKLASFREQEKSYLNPPWRLSVGMVFSGNSTTNSNLNDTSGCCAGWQLGIERKFFNVVGVRADFNLLGNAGNSNSSNPNKMAGGEIALALPIYFGNNFYIGPEVGKANSTYTIYATPTSSTSISTNQTFFGAVAGCNGTIYNSWGAFIDLGFRQYQSDGNYQGAGTVKGSVGVFWGF